MRSGYFSLFFACLDPTRQWLQAAESLELVSKADAYFAAANVALDFAVLVPDT
jgi:hypothetical protein